jgi:hypothetical protein
MVNIGRLVIGGGLLALIAMPSVHFKHQSDAPLRQQTESVRVAPIVDSVAANRVGS